MSLFARRTPALHLGGLPRVDLLPPSEMRRRGVRTRIRLWGWIASAALVVAVAAVGGALAFHMSATLALSAEQARTQQILTGIASLSEVSSALALRTELTRLEEETMAGDLSWEPVVDLVRSRLPEGVIIRAYALDAGPVPIADVPASDATGVTGTVTVSSERQIPVRDITRTLRDVDAVRVAEVEALLGQDGGASWEYRMRLVVDQSFYTGAFADETEDAG
jgi:hypothetical protein